MQGLKKAYNFSATAQHYQSDLKEMLVLVADLTGATMLQLFLPQAIVSLGVDPLDTALQPILEKITHQLQKTLYIADTNKHPLLKEQPLRINDAVVKTLLYVPILSPDGDNLGGFYLFSHSEIAYTPLQLNVIDYLAKDVVKKFQHDEEVSLLKAKLEEAKSNENTLRSFVDSSGSSQVLISKNLKVLDYNTQMKNHLLQLTHKEIKIGGDVLDYLSPASRANFKANIYKCLAGEPIIANVKVDYEFESIWWHNLYTPVFDDKGNIIAVSFSSMDITQKVKNEESLLLHQSSLKQIAWMQSHELRKPVASILGLMELIKLENNQVSDEILSLLNYTTKELDEKIRLIAAKITDI